jgi:hypothetical protein
VGSWEPCGGSPWWCCRRSDFFFTSNARPLDDDGPGPCEAERDHRRAVLIGGEALLALSAGLAATFVAVVSRRRDEFSRKYLTPA